MNISFFGTLHESLLTDFLHAFGKLNFNFNFQPTDSAANFPVPIRVIIMVSTFRGTYYSYDYYLLITGTYYSYNYYLVTTILEIEDFL